MSDRSPSEKISDASKAFLVLLLGAMWFCCPCQLPGDQWIEGLITVVDESGRPVPDASVQIVSTIEGRIGPSGFDQEDREIMGRTDLKGERFFTCWQIPGTPHMPEIEILVEKEGFASEKFVIQQDSKGSHIFNGKVVLKRKAEELSIPAETIAPTSDGESK